MKILVVDDHNAIVDGLILDLKELEPDSQIIGSTKPEEIKALCNNEAFDIIFMDIEMPSLNGISLAKAVLKKYPHTNIIFVTGYEKYALESYDIPASTFLIKPITQKQIKKALETLRFPISGIDDNVIQLEFAGNEYIGKQIQKYREERGMSRAELAGLINILLLVNHVWN